MFDLSFWTVLLTILVCVLIYKWLLIWSSYVDLPGPRAWPLVGNSLQMNPTEPHKTLTEWSRQYGDIYKVQIFSDDVIIFNDYDSAYEMLTSEVCSSRPHIFRFNDFVLKDLKDIITGSFSNEWLDNKKAFSRSLNAYGTGLKKIESVSQTSLDKLHASIKESSQQFSGSVDMKPHLHLCIIGIVTTLHFGKSMSESELMEMMELERGILQFLSNSGLISVLDVFPWMRFLPLESIQEPQRKAEKCRHWIDKKFKEFEETLNEDSEGILVQLKSNINKVTRMNLKQADLQGMTFDLIMAGFITTSSSLYALNLILINHPRVQDKVNDEIQRIIGERRPTIADKANMPYMRAVLEELLRFTSIVPLGIQHYSTKATNISGKNIPKDTTLIANLWNINHDVRYFEEPWMFKPERFLRDDGELLPRDNKVWRHVMAFSRGRRVCAGETLARTRIFLIVTDLLQKYEFLPEDSSKIPSCDPRQYQHGVVLGPKQYKVNVVLR